MAEFHQAVINLDQTKYPALIIIDDPQSCFLEGGGMVKGMDRFFAELVNLNKLGKLNVLFLSSTRDVVGNLKECTLTLC